jgi:hypothetical protein
MEVFKDLARATYTVTDWLATRAIQAVTSPNPDGWSDARVAWTSIVGALLIAVAFLAVIFVPKWCRDLAEQRRSRNSDTSRTLTRETVS